MSKTIITEGDEGVRLIIKDAKTKQAPRPTSTRSPVHVVYGGADRFSADIPAKLGKIALDTVEKYAPNFVEFAAAMRLAGSERLPSYPKAVAELEKKLKSSPDKVKTENFAAWFAWTVYRKTIEKLKREPVEDFRIDFEDGYGFRSDEEEDAHAIAASDALAAALKNKKLSPFCGFRIKSLRDETFGRSVDTLRIFLDNLVAKTSGRLPENFVVTLPKVTDSKQVKDLCKRLAAFEKKHGLAKNSIGVELMIETPESIIDKKGRIAVRDLVNAAKGRCTSAHFGAYDYTSALGISAAHQTIRHPACSFARQMMLTALAGSGVRLVDSVTTEMPVPIHKNGKLSASQIAENRRIVHAAWHTHFQNVTNSMIDGFYQSWDLHPNQLVARYAAVYAFFIETMDAHAERLRGFVEKATKASLTGNTFDDAASVQGILNFFRRGIDCGAFSEGEVKDLTGLTIERLRIDSFLRS